MAFLTRKLSTITRSLQLPKHFTFRRLSCTLFFCISFLYIVSHTNPPPSQTSSHQLSSIRAVVINDATPAALHLTLSSLRTHAPSVPITVYHVAAPVSLPTYVHSATLSSHRPYDIVLHPLRTSSSIYLRAGTKITAHAVPWLQSARSAYSTRPDIAAFSLRAAKISVKHGVKDADPFAWKSVTIDDPAVGYGLFVGGDAFMPNIAPNMPVWDVFAEWLLGRRGDWYRYPGGLGVDGTPLGMDSAPERNWTRGTWNVWFSKFLAEYRLKVLFPNIRVPLIENDNTTGQKGLTEMPKTLRVFNGEGKVERQSIFQENTIQTIVNLAERQGGVISFTMVNNVFLQTAKSWLCNVDVAGFRPRGLVWVATDAETKEALRTVDNSHVVLLDEITGGKETGHEFGNPGYWKLMLERTLLIGEILNRGIAVFAFETDAIWLENPQPYIEQLVAQDADIVGTINTRQEVSGNFFYLRPTLATRRLWQEISNGFEAAFRNARFEKKSATSWTYIENDQSLLTKLVLRNETWRKSYPLSFLTLDTERFADGRWYKPEEGFYTSDRARKPVVINNNFVIGIEEKTSRAKKWGHWFWDEETQQCLQDAVRKVVRQSFGGDRKENIR